MKVAKFGGTSLASAEQVKKICDIITADPERRLTVVSAPGKRRADDTKVTDLLIATARARMKGDKGDNGDSGEDELRLVLDRYAEIARDLGLSSETMEPIERDFYSRLHLPCDDEGLYMDTMKAGGEDNSARLVAEYLRSIGVEAHYVNPKDGGMILSDEPGNARVLKQSYGKLRSLR